MHHKRWSAMLAATMLGAATTIPSFAFAHGIPWRGIARPVSPQWGRMVPHFQHPGHGPQNFGGYGAPESEHAKVSSKDRGKARHEKESKESRHVAGVINAVYQTSVVIGSKSLLTSRSTAVRYHSYHLTIGDIPTGVHAMALVKSGRQAKWIQLFQDSNLPSEPSVIGAVYVSGQAIQIRSYTLALSPQVNVSYHDWRLNPAQIPAGARAKVHLTQRALVNQINLFTDAALPPHPTLTGTVSSVYQSGLTVDGYTLRYASSPVRVMNRGHRLSVRAIAVGQRVKVQLNRWQRIDWVKIYLNP